MKYFLFLLGLVPSCLTAQTNIIAKAELSPVRVFKDSHLLFKISITNNSKEIIIIPDSNAILTKKENYTENTVGFQLKPPGKKTVKGCNTFTDQALYPKLQEIKPSEKKYITVLYPKNCFRNNRKYIIEFFLKIMLKNHSSNENEYTEIKVEALSFKL